MTICPRHRTWHSCFENTFVSGFALGPLSALGRRAQALADHRRQPRHEAVVHRVFPIRPGARPLFGAPHTRHPASVRSTPRSAVQEESKMWQQLEALASDESGSNYDDDGYMQGNPRP